MNSKKYIIVRTKKNKKTKAKGLKKIKGYKVTPKNNIEYPIFVNSLIIVKPSLIEKVLKKKIKKKLDFYLQYIIEDNDDTEDSEFKEALSSVSRYKDTVEFKYRKFLEDKYIELLLKKINLLEHELKNKITYVKPKKEKIEYYEEETKGKSR